MDVLFMWFKSFVEGCGQVWNWLITEYDFIIFKSEPIFIICGSLLIVGIVRAIIGII